MKDAAAGIIGKRITGVVVKQIRKGGGPRGQLFLVFEDGSSFEFYSVDGCIVGAGGLDRGGLVQVLRYLPDSHRVEWAAVRDPDTGQVSVDRYDA
jgi:hypothetical protein